MGNNSGNNSGEGFDLIDTLILNPQTGDTVADKYDQPATLVNILVSNVFVASGVVIFLMILFAGLKFALSPESKGKEDAKKIAEGAGIGFLVMFSAYWILQILQIVTGIENLI